MWESAQGVPVSTWIDRFGWLCLNALKRSSVVTMSEEKKDHPEHPHHHLTHNTDERAVSDVQSSKWGSEGGAVPPDYDPDLEDDEEED